MNNRSDYWPFAVVYAGLGIILANRLRDWFPNGQPWIALTGIVLVVVGGAWSLRIWRRKRAAK